MKLRLNVSESRADGGLVVILLLLAAAVPPRGVGAQAKVTPVSRLVDYEPAWSPDGRQLVFISNRAGALKVWTMRADGSDPRQLTQGTAEDDTPAWSPDGSTIAYVSLVDGDADIYLMNADGSGALRLTSSPGDDIHPQWSPDGTRILFNSSRHSRDLGHPDVYEIFSMRTDGTGLEQLTHGGIATYASYSPKGSELVFRRQMPDGNSEIVVRAVSGGDEVNVSRHPGFDGWPAWSRDGRRIVFARETGDSDASIMIVSREGSGLTTLVDQPGRNTNPRWSPTEDLVVFSQRSGQQVRLYTVTVP